MAAMRAQSVFWGLLTWSALSASARAEWVSMSMVGTISSGSLTYLGAEARSFQRSAPPRPLDLAGNQAVVSFSFDTDAGFFASGAISITDLVTGITASVTGWAPYDEVYSHAWDHAAGSGSDGASLLITSGSQTALSSGSLELLDLAGRFFETGRLTRGSLSASVTTGQYVSGAQYELVTMNVSINAVPEPSGGLLAGLGMGAVAGLGVYRRGRVRA